MGKESNKGWEKISAFKMGAMTRVAERGVESKEKISKSGFNADLPLFEVVEAPIGLLP